jgi:ABC-type transport system involved in cytochrome c biogenesis permease subunit
MEHRSYRENVDVKVHLSMEHIVQTVCANTAFVQPTQLHHSVIVIMDVDAQHGARGLGFCAIYAIPLIQNVKDNANQIFLVQNVRERVLQIYHMITITMFAILCVPQVENVTHAMDMVHVKMAFANATLIGLTMVEKIVYDHVRVRQRAMAMAPVNCTVILPGAYAKRVGMDPNVISHVPEC